jgi:hypothetical protein
MVRPPAGDQFNLMSAAHRRCSLLAAADGDDDGAIHGDDVNRAFRAAFVGVVAR